MIIGYARVSTKEQNLNLQIDALKNAGCEIIFEEKLSGKNLERKSLNELISKIKKGDHVIVWKLDRLGRSLKDLIQLINLFNNKEIVFVSLEDNINTNTALGKFSFHLFGALAEFERNLISERTKAGLEAAKKRGRKGGRPKGLSKQNLIVAKAIKMMFDDENKTMAKIAEAVSKSRTTCYRYYEYIKNQHNKDENKF